MRGLDVDRGVRAKTAPLSPPSREGPESLLTSQVPSRVLSPERICIRPIDKSTTSYPASHHQVVTTGPLSPASSTLTATDGTKDEPVQDSQEKGGSKSISRENERTSLTSSACFPPSYKTNSTLTFSRCVVSNRTDSFWPKYPADPNRKPEAAPVVLLPLNTGLAPEVDELCRARHPCVEAEVVERGTKDRKAEREKRREGVERGSTILTVLRPLRGYV